MRHGRVIIHLKCVGKAGEGGWKSRRVGRTVPVDIAILSPKFDGVTAILSVAFSAAGVFPLRQSILIQSPYMVLLPVDRRDLAPSFSVLSVVLAVCGVIFLSGGASAQSPQPEVFGKLYHCKPGPWGDVEYYYIYLEAPDRLVDHFTMPNSLPKWVFRDATETSLRALFARAGLPAALQDYLLDPKRAVKEGDLLTVFPPLPDLIAMSPEQRTVIYHELAKVEFNEFHTNPVFITSGDPEQWLAQSRLRPELVDVIKKMTYMRGEVLCFSDVSAILGMVKTDEEAHDIFKTMTRIRSLVMRLRVNSESDMKTVVNYWSGTNRNKDIEPIVLSAVETEGIDRLDCIHLLPSLARRYLYSYPPAELAIQGRMPDCHWTSLNFFNYTPRDYFLDTRLASMHVLENYEKVDAPYAFGDVLMFMTAEGNALHSCVYIADDIVYTKNGENIASPWLLMKIGDVQRIYSYEQQTFVQGYRLKSLKNSTGE